MAIHPLTDVEVKVADEVWLVTALLQRENPSRLDFTVDEIVERAKQETITESLRPGVRVHVLTHCVANRAPQPNEYRMLYETRSGYRRLFRPGDNYDPARKGKTIPKRDEIPSKYQYLVDWYSKWSGSSAPAKKEMDALLALRGSGRELWKDEHADAYVRRLREGWE